MKNERNEFAMLIEELLLFVLRIVLTAAVLIGILFIIGLIVELFSGYISLATGFFLILTVAGVIIYHDNTSPRGKSKSGQHRVARRPERRVTHNSVC